VRENPLLVRARRAVSLLQGAQCLQRLQVRGDPLSLAGGREVGL
jgi:hypothetical protein